MFFVRRPSGAAIQRFLVESRALPLSYGPSGVLRSCPAHVLDHARFVIGRGRDDFARAQQALRAWQQFDLGWVELFPRESPTEDGSVVAVLIRHLGFYSLNGCRVTYQIDAGGARFGYAYGTLPNHAESGEELFEVTFDTATEDVHYQLTATSRPQSLLARIGQPYVRLLQARFRRHSAAAMGRAVAARR